VYEKCDTMHIHYENTTKIKPIARGEIKLSIDICRDIFCLYLAWLQSAKNDEIWLTYIGEVDISSSTQVKFSALSAKIVC